MRLKKPPIYISYAWNDDKLSEEYIVANKLCDTLKSQNFKVIRDTDYLSYLDNVQEFLHTVGTGGYVIVIVGNKYIHSENCMIEASFMALKGHLRTRVFPIILSSLENIYHIDSRTALIKSLYDYWAPKETEIQEFLNKKNYPQGFLSTRNDLALITQLINNLSVFINHLGTSIQLTSQEHIQESFKSIIKEIKIKIDSDLSEIKASIILGSYNRNFLVVLLLLFMTLSFLSFKIFINTPFSSRFYFNIDNNYIYKNNFTNNLLNSKLILYLPNGPSEYIIGENNTVLAQNINPKYKNKIIKIELINFNWEISKDSFKLKPGDLNIELQPSSFLGTITGSVKDRAGDLPLTNCQISINMDTIIYSQSNGAFTCLLPFNMRRPQYLLNISCMNYTQCEKEYYPGSPIEIRLDKL